MGPSVMGDKTERVGEIEMDLNTLSYKEFGVIGANPLQELGIFFSILLLETKQNERKSQQTFPIHRYSLKARYGL